MNLSVKSFFSFFNRGIIIIFLLRGNSITASALRPLAYSTL